MQYFRAHARSFVGKIRMQLYTSSILIDKASWYEINIHDSNCSCTSNDVGGESSGLRHSFSDCATLEIISDKAPHE